MQSAAFVRSKDAILFPEANHEDSEDSGSGVNAPDIEIMSAPVAFEDHGFGQVPLGDLCSVGAVILR